MYFYLKKKLAEQIIVSFKKKSSEHKLIYNLIGIPLFIKTVYILIKLRSEQCILVIYTEL